MEVTTYVCGSCAVSSLSAVGSHKNAEDALDNFCKKELGVKTSFQKEYRKLVCYYVFCAGPEVKSTEAGGSWHSKDHWPKYGTELAEYIKTNNLGEVVTLGPKFNAKHHATTTAQVWIWSPKQEAVETWWSKRSVAAAAVVTAPAPTIAYNPMPQVPIQAFVGEDEADDYEEDDYEPEYEPEDDPDYDNGDDY